MARKFFSDNEDDEKEYEKEKTSAQEEAPPPDETPVIQKLAMDSTHPHGQKEMQTDIRALIHAPSGYASKRLIVSGAVTAQRLADLLLGVAGW